MLSTGIKYFGRPCVVICDGQCHKAWGINNRPRVRLSGDPDDYEYLADDELPEAPADPGTYEGGDGKPARIEHGHNRWCARECERSVIAGVGQKFELPDFTKRLRNKPHEAGEWLQMKADLLSADDMQDMMMRGEKPDGLSRQDELVWEAVAQQVCLNVAAAQDPDIAPKLAYLTDTLQRRLDRRIAAAKKERMDK